MAGELVLLVDDEPNIIQLARLYLEREQFRVEAVGNGPAALEAVSHLRPALMVLDVMLPGLDGFEVCRRLRAEGNLLPILMLTAKDEDIDKILGLELGADDYLTKPFNPRELVARVKAISSPGRAEVIYTEAGRMYRLVVDLLDLARMDAGIAGFERSPLDLGALLKNVAAKFEPLARHDQVTMQTELDELPKIHGDSDRLAQVFTNLVDNALKYTPPGGHIILKAQMEQDQVIVSVSDNGAGILPNELERIFERFYQTDKSRPGGRRGVGLGLAIAREIVQAHGGVLSAENNSTQGSVFVVKLPLVRMDHAKRV